MLGVLLSLIVFNSQQPQRPREEKRCAQGIELFLVSGRAEVRTQDHETPEPQLCNYCAE